MKELLRLKPYILRYRKKILWGFLFVTLANITMTYTPRVVGLTIDKITTGKLGVDGAIPYILLILALSAGEGIFGLLTRQTIMVASRYIEYDLRKDFLFAIERQPMRFYNTNPTGQLMAYASNDITAAREFLGPAVMYSANTMTTFVFAMYFMFSLNPSITLMALAPLPVIAITTYIIGKKVHIAFKDVQAQFADITTQAQESFSGIRVIRSYVREGFERRIFGSLSTDYLNKNLRLARLQSITMPILMILVGLSLIIVLGYGGKQVIMGKATLGDLAQFFIYLNLLIWPVAAIGWITNIIQRASASAARLGIIFDNIPEAMDNAGTDHKITDLKGNIDFKDVSLRYEPDLPYALQDISFSVPAGSSLGVIGMVGSGKSSLVHLLPRLYEPTEGKVLLDGNDIKKIPIEVLKVGIGIVTQDIFLFSTTIEENIKFGKPEASHDEVVEAAKKAALDEDINAFPEGYDTILGERGITLSGGQKQRVAIARAILRNPSILILDDALSAIDAQTEEKILHALREIMKNRTTIIISHRISTVKDADLIITLENGKLTEAGNHENLLKNHGRYYELYNQQLIEEELEQL